MKILVACEYSGTTRDAFAAKGWDAWSCDLLPSDTPGNHYQGSALDILDWGWDMMVAHPPCTYLSSAGLHFCDILVHGERAIERIKKRNKAIEFFLDLYAAPIKHICIENPIGHISSAIMKPTQLIHPYYFGESELKRTALWLKNLPPLNYTLEHNLFEAKTSTDYPKPYQTQLCKKTGKMKNRYFTDGISNGRLKTGHEKSKSFQCIAQAMAEQWTEFYLSNQIQ